MELQYHISKLTCDCDNGLKDSIDSLIIDYRRTIRSRNLNRPDIIPRIDLMISEYDDSDHSCKIMRSFSRGIIPLLKQLK